MNIEAGNDIDETPIKKEEILDKVHSAYEAVVAIAREARRLNAAPGVYLKVGEKPIPRAVRNFVEGKVEYGLEENGPGGARYPGKGNK